MRRQQVSLLTTVLVCVVVALTSYVVGTRSTTILAVLRTGHSSRLDTASLQAVYDELRMQYDGTLDTDKLIDGAKHGLVEAAGDPYTTYLNADEAKSFANDLEGTFSGIGAELGKRDGYLSIISTLDGSPARQAGLLPHDVIVRINGQDATSWTIDKAVSQIRGEEGTTVKLSIVRGDEAVRDITITRHTVTDPSVKTEIIDDIGIMRISRFGGTETVTLAQQAAQSFADKKVKGVIVDVRGNGGGYLESAQDVASLWLRDKVVVTERRNGKVTDTLRSGRDPVLIDMPTVVLVDGGSASASEILAGALRDNGAAQLVGEKTFGKGSVQTIKDLMDGAQLKITVAKWYTPGGKNISKEGIAPDVKVVATADELTAGRDVQRAKAMGLLE